MTSHHLTMYDIASTTAQQFMVMEFWSARVEVELIRKVTAR